MKIIVDACAKINLLLDINNRLPNGYHSLYMIMQSVSLSDTVTVEKGNRRLICSDPEIPTDSRNIAWKAVAAFEKATGIDCTDTCITLEKRIPHGAGLAGGSTNGAAVLAALNILYETKLSDEALCRIGATFGADVPFCLLGGTRLALNIGDVLAPLPPLQDVTILLAKPDCTVSTKDAYEAFDCSSAVSHVNLSAILFDAAKGDYKRVFRQTCNTFEELIEVADRVPIKAAMRRHGCGFSMMSGSGPTVFGVFCSESDAQNCAEELRTFTPNVHLCRPTEKSLHIRVE